MSAAHDPLSDSERTRAWLVVAAFLLTVVYLVVSHAWPGAAIVGCPFRAVTGYSCPGCGMTRSTSHFLHGDLVAAVRFHPLGPPFLLAFAAFAAHRAAELIARRRLEYAALRWWRRIEGPALIAAAIFLGLFGAIRLALELTGFLTPI